MTRDSAALYSILAARDARFDGIFYVGVTSTGIYCRPICTARTPKARNCRFFDSAEAAEKAAFRPCLRCRPELAPGNAPVDDARRIASMIARRIDEGLLDDGASLETIAARFGWSSRQIRRIVKQELGVSPIELVLTRRLLLAKQLLTDTALPVTEVAFASGFASLRRFNDAFRGRYGMPPTRFRRDADAKALPPAAEASLTLQLSYRPPFDWEGTLRFLRARAMQGVELVTDDAYARTVRLGRHLGWVRVTNRAERNSVRVELSQSLTPALPALLGRLRHLFDLDARPDVIASHLARDARLRPLVRRNPGLRVPGAFDGFELAVRAILGQQVSVAAATTLGGRFAAAFGEPLQTPHEGLERLSPISAAIASRDPGDVAALGLPRTRAATIVGIARALASGDIELEAGADPDRAIAALVSLPGIGPWTAHYIAMRALRWPDAFPKEDVALRKRLGGVTPARAEAMSADWRPWRSYATMHVWAAGTVS